MTKGELPLLAASTAVATGKRFAQDLGEEVRAAMDLTRQALDASNAEIERAKRILRKTGELAELRSQPVSEQPVPALTKE